MLKKEFYKTISIQLNYMKENSVNLVSSMDGVSISLNNTIVAKINKNVVTITEYGQNDEVLNEYVTDWNKHFIDNMVVLSAEKMLKLVN